MPSDRTIRRQLTNTYVERGIASRDEIQGRFAKEEASTVVGAGAKYPAASPGTINNDAVVSMALNGPDPVGYDQTSAPIVGAQHEIEAAAKALADPKHQLAAILARFDDRELRREFARIDLEMRQQFENTARLDELQLRRDAVEAELDRRRRGVSQEEGPVRRL
jgi:hypothetical protein